MLLARAALQTPDMLAKRAEACLARGRDADSVAAWFESECLIRLSESEREEVVRDPEGFVRAKLADLTRLELTQFERWIILSTLDNAWKDNLHAMDQIRDAIGLRAFSQKDPRIEFKRESARVFAEMQENVRDRVTDVAFLGRFMPQASRPPMRPQPVAAIAAGEGAGEGGDNGAGDGAGESASAPQAMAPRRAAPQQPPAAAERALASESPVDPATIPVVGRNEPCPCGSGMKYRQCHGKKPEAQA